MIERAIDNMLLTSVYALYQCAVLVLKLRRIRHIPAPST